MIKIFNLHSFNFVIVKDPLTSVEDIRMSSIDVILKNEKDALLASEVNSHAESFQTANAGKLSDNMSLCESMEMEPDRICLLETRKKSKISPITTVEGIKQIIRVGLCYYACI